MSATTIIVNDETPRRQYTASAGQTVFDFPFPFFADGDLEVYLTPNGQQANDTNDIQTIVTDYTVSGANTQSGGQITLTSGATAGDIVTILRIVDIDRTADYQAAGDLLAETLNAEQDTEIMISQQLREEQERSIRSQKSDVTVDMTLPSAADRADGVLTFDTNGSPSVTSPAQFVSGLTGAILGANYVTNSATGDGTTLVYTVSVAPGSKTNIQIYIDGVYQNKASFSVSGTTVTFTQAPPLNSSIEFMIGYAIASASGAGSITFTQAGTGAVTRTVESKLQDVVSVKDFGAVGDGVTDDTSAINNAKTAIETNANGILTLPKGKYKTTSTIYQNHVSPTSMPFDKPSIIGLFEGNNSNPDTVTNDPLLFGQKITKYDSNNRFTHNVGGLFGECVVKGTGVTGNDDTDGTWIGILGNAVIEGTNQGSSASPDFDAFGSSIGVAGFARTNGYPGDGNIVTGVWGYAEGPTLDATTQANLPATNWSLVGFESNIQINHQDIGEQSVLAGKGAAAGFLAFNYRTPSTGVKDWQFGMVLNGNPDDNNYASTDIDNWNGFYCGILIDKIKSKGIRFGQYMKDGSYGIYFPDNYIGSEEPKAAIYIGNSKLNLGEYTGSTFYDGDVWYNSDAAFIRKDGVSAEIVASEGVGTSASYTGDRKIKVNINGTDYYLIASTTA